MILAEVVGRQVSSEKHPRYEGTALLWVQPLGLPGDGPAGAFLALDTVGAGHGERVLVLRDGGASIIALRRPATPVDAAIVGIVDRIDLEGAPGAAR